MRVSYSSVMARGSPPPQVRRPTPLRDARLRLRGPPSPAIPREARLQHAQPPPPQRPRSPGSARGSQRTARLGPPPSYAFICRQAPRRLAAPLASTIRASRIQHGQPPPGGGPRPCGCNCSGQKASPTSPPPPAPSQNCHRAPVARAATPVGEAANLRFHPPQPPPGGAASGRRYSCEAGHPPHGRGGRSLRRPLATTRSPT